MTVPTSTPLKAATPLFTKPHGCNPSNNSKYIQSNINISNSLKNRIKVSFYNLYNLIMGIENKSLLIYNIHSKLYKKNDVNLKEFYIHTSYKSYNSQKRLICLNRKKIIFKLEFTLKSYYLLVQLFHLQEHSLAPP